MSTVQKNGYRRELDGLRSIAVLAVLFYHFAIPGFGGGFVGVDVFFVLSGFFIGRLLWVELIDTGRINYFRFLLRRVRRLAPAYFLMILVVSVLAYKLLLPFEYRFFGKELIASTVYMSNIMYFREAGYFDIGADSKNLLHTWSLSVEEQFYIFLPLLMLMFARHSRALLWFVPALFVASLVSCILVTQFSPTATFFLFPFRAWELLAGVMLAIFGQRYGFSWSLNSVFSWVGIVLIAGSIVFIPAGENFPGALAILPVLGTALMIANGRHPNIVNRALSHPLPVFFGLISYSLYLWHWPIATLSKYVSDGGQGALERAALIGLSVLLAWLSWRFVETPIRRGKLSGRSLLSGTVLASAVTLGTGGLIYVKDGAPGRFPEGIRMHVDATADFLQDWSRCTTPDEGIWQGIELCPIGPEGAPRVLIWGDSHVRAYKEGLELAAFEADVPAVIIWRAGCPPLLGVGKKENSATPLQNAACAQANAQIASALDEFEAVETLFLIGRWAYYTEGTGIGQDTQNTIEVFSQPGSAVTGETQADIMASAWGHSIDALSSRFGDIFVLRQAPEISDYDARDVARRLVHGHLDESEAPTSIPISEVERRSRSADEILWSLKDLVTVLDTWAEFCDANTCSTIHEGRSDYFDNNHVTNTAARRVRHLFYPVFEASG